MWRCWESGALERAWKLCTPSHIPCRMHLSHLAAPELYPFKISSDLVSPSSVSFSSKVIEPKEAVKVTSDVSM